MQHRDYGTSRHPSYKGAGAQRVSLVSNTMVENSKAPPGASSQRTGGAPSVESEVTRWVSDGQDSLDRHILDEASELFQRALATLTDREKARGVGGREKLYVKALSGLAEVYSRRGRSVRHNECQWYHMLLQAVTVQQELLDYCNALMQQEDTKKAFWWVSDARDRAALQLRKLDEGLFESIKKHMGKATPDALRHLESRHTRKRSLPPGLNTMSWCGDVVSYIQEQYSENQIDDVFIDVDVPVESRAVNGAVDSLHQTNGGVVEDQAAFAAHDQGPVRVKVDYDRVQTAILQLVRQISSDMRQKFVRKRLPEDMLRQTVSGEMMAKFGPTPESSDIVGLFENAILQRQYGLTAEEFMEYQERTSVSESDVESERSLRNSKTIHLSFGADALGSMWTDTVEDLAFSDEPYDLPGVLTIWRSQCRNYNAQSLSISKPYKLQAFEELSPLTETSTLMPSDEDIINDKPSAPVSLSRDSLVPSQTLLSDLRLKGSFANVLIKAAEKLQAQEEWRMACDLYKYALGVYEKFPKDSRPYDRVAYVLKNVGIIKCRLGDIDIGSQLMEDAIDLYTHHAGNNSTDASVADVWFCLGNAYMTDQWKSCSVLEHMMRAVKEELEREERERDAADGEDDEDDSSDSDSSDGDSYPLCTQEAINCYNSALAILSRLRKKKKEVCTSLYVDVLTKLGDCCIVTTDYERAVLCYEEALYLCQNTLGSTSLTNSAHILSMLGSTNFLLGNFSKAVTMYETAHILQQHLYGAEDNFEMAFTLTMYGITYYVMKHYHKSIAWCLKSFDLYTNIYRENILGVDDLIRWYIAQTLYTTGYAYSTLNFYEKSLYYLELSRNMIMKTKEKRHQKQLIRVLKTIADVYAATDEHDEALKYYNEALELCEQLGHESSTLQNQLLNRIAGVHVSAKEYSTAAQYLEQALDYQRTVETSIKGDLVGTLHQLGITYTLAGDIDRAVECYNESYDAYKEDQASPGPEIARTLGNLGMLYHLKYCLQDEEEEEAMMHYLNLADAKYQEAIRLDPYSGISVQYANFLYQQNLSAEALLTLLPLVFLRKPLDEMEIIYNGPEQAVLPDHLLNDLNDINEVTLETRVFARYLAILCFKNLSLFADAEDCLVLMYADVITTKVALNFTLLGYSLLEMNLYQEAAEVFRTSWKLAREDGELAFTNMWISLCLWAYVTIARAFYGSLEHFYEWYVDLTLAPVVCVDRRGTELADYDNEYHVSNATGEEEDEFAHFSYQPALKSVREDEEEEEENEETVWEETVDTPSDVLNALRSSQYRDTQGIGIAHPDTENNGDEADYETWTSEEVTMDTPAVVLRASGLDRGPATKESGEDSEYGTWTFDEVTVDTPAAVLRASGMNVRGDTYEEVTLTSGMDVHADPENPEEEEYGTWTSEEVTVETPAVVLRAMSVSRDSDQDYQSTEYQSTNYQSTDYRSTDYQSTDNNTTSYNTLPTLTAGTGILNATDNDNGLDNDEEWRTSEETVSTPIEILESLKGHSLSQEAHTSYTHGKDGKYYSTNTMVTPSYDNYCRTTSNRCFSSTTGTNNNEVHVYPSSRYGPEVTTSDDGTDQEETWETIEEVVETPQEILQVLMANQRNL